MAGRPTGIFYIALYYNDTMEWHVSMYSDLLTSRNAQRPSLIPRPEEEPGNEATQDPKNICALDTYATSSAVQLGFDFDNVFHTGWHPLV